MKKGMLILLLGLFLIVGCQKITTTDPNTGIVTTQYAIDPNGTAKPEAIAEIGLVISTGLGAFFPLAAAIAGILGGVLATWKKYKPQLTAAQKSETLAYNATSSLVGLIEDLKDMNPETWEALKTKLKIGPEVENVIRSIRGLPPLV